MAQDPLHRWRLGAALGFSLLGCNALPSQVPPAPGSGARAGTNVGISAVFFADFAALAKAGKLTALAPLLTRAIANGSAGDLIKALELLQRSSKAAPLAQALGALLTGADQAPLSAVLGENGPAHLLLSDPLAAPSTAALAALSRTGVLRAGGYAALDQTAQSPLTGALLPDLSEAFRQGGPDVALYLGAALGLTETAASGDQEPVGLAALDLGLSLQAEGRLHPLLDPFLAALESPSLAQSLRAVGAVVGDLRQQPGDLAEWTTLLDALGPTLGTGLLARELTSPDGVSPSPLRQLDSALIEGQIDQPYGAQTAGQPTAKVTLLDNLAGMLGGDGSLGSQSLAAMRGEDPARVTKVATLVAPFLLYPYHDGQPVTDGSRSGSPVGFVQLAYLIHDGMVAHSDTQALSTLLANTPGALSVLSSIMQCGPIDPSSPLTNIPNYAQSISLQLFDDVNGQADDLAAAQRMTFLACFFSRFNRVQGYLTNSFSSSVLNLFGVDPAAIVNPSVQFVLQNDAEGLGVLGATYDPDFDLSKTDETALGTQVRDGALRVLYPMFNVLEQHALDPSAPAYTNSLRYVTMLAGSLAHGSYTGPDGQPYSVSGGDLLSPLLPLLEPLLTQPSASNSAATQLVSYAWNVAQGLPVDGSTVGDTWVRALAAAAQRHQLPSAPPLWGPALDALVAHRDDVDRLLRALWPAGGSFALDGAPGTVLPFADVLLSGGNGRPGVSGMFAGPAPRTTAPAELRTLMSAPFDQGLAVMADLRRADPTLSVYHLGQRLLIEGAGTGLSQTLAATLDVPGIVPLLHLSLQTDLLPQAVDLLEMVDQAHLTVSLLSLGDTFVQGDAALESLNLLDLTLQGTGP